MKRSNTILLIALGVLVAIMFAFLIYARVTFGRITEEGRAHAGAVYSRVADTKGK